MGVIVPLLRWMAFSLQLYEHLVTMECAGMYVYIYTHIFVLYFCTPTSLPSEKKLYVGCLFIDRIREGPSYCNWGNRAFWPFKLLTFPWVTQCGFPTALISVALNLMPSAWSASFHGVSQQKKRVAHTLKTHVFVAYHVKRGFLGPTYHVKRGFPSETKKTPKHFLTQPPPKIHQTFPPTGVDSIHHEGWFFVERTYPTTASLLQSIAT